MTEKDEVEFNMLVRDFTSHGFMSKAEAKERLAKIILKNRQDLVYEIIGDLESNPHVGEEYKNLGYWIESKQRQLKEKYGIIQ